MLWDWAKRIGTALILIGITLGLIGAIPLLSPQQDASAPPDYKTVIIAVALVGAGLVIVIVVMLLAAFFQRDDFQDL
jgi:uncharacterized membrane protein YidH (DUF202 family)